MKIAIRVDASREIGYGHVVRCLALADALGRLGHEVVFFCQQLAGDAVAQIREAGFLCWLLSPVQSIEDDTDQTLELLDHAPGWDWLIVDHYSLGLRWSRGMRTRVRRIMIIDDLANRLLDCDVLLDQNLHDVPENRYRGLIPAATTCLLGPNYALLRPSFARLRQTLAVRDGRLSRVLICFGGADPQNATQQVVGVLASAFPQLSLDVVVGAAYRWFAELCDQSARYSNVRVAQDVQDMPRRMIEADFFIGSGGSMTWERACLGLPGMTISIAPNQEALCARLAKDGAGLDLGPLSSTSTARITDFLRSLVLAPEAVLAMRESLSGLCDGLGAERVARRLTELSAGDALAAADHSCTHP